MKDLTLNIRFYLKMFETERFSAIAVSEADSYLNVTE